MKIIHETAFDVGDLVFLRSYPEQGVREVVGLDTHISEHRWPPDDKTPDAVRETIDELVRLSESVQLPTEKYQNISVRVSYLLKLSDIQVEMQRLIDLNEPDVAYVRDRIARLQALYDQQFGKKKRTKKAS